MYDSKFKLTPELITKAMQGEADAKYNFMFTNEIEKSVLTPYRV